MKICILHNSSPGGAQRLVDEIATRLRETDDVTICSWGDAAAVVPAGVKQLWCPPPPLRLHPPLHPFGDLARSYIGSARAAREVVRRRFDVALVFACRWGQAPEALRHLPIPHVYFAQEGRRRTVESNYLPAPRGGRQGSLPRRLGTRLYDMLGGRLDRRAIRAAQVVITNSAHSARQLASAYGVAAKVVELGVDVELFRPGGSGPRHRVALLVGGLDPTKGGDLAVRSLAHIPTSFRPTLRLIANRGDDRYGTHLVLLGRSIGVNVEVLRCLSEEALIAEYQSAQLLLALAQNEPFGLTVLEASACGTPTVAVAEGGYLRTVKPGVNGILVARHSEGVGTAVAAVIAGDAVFDAQAMSLWAAESWSWDRCVSEVRSELRSLYRSDGASLGVGVRCSEQACTTYRAP